MDRGRTSKWQWMCGNVLCAAAMDSGDDRQNERETDTSTAGLAAQLYASGARDARGSGAIGDDSTALAASNSELCWLGTVGVAGSAQTNAILPLFQKTSDPRDLGWIT